MSLAKRFKKLRLKHGLTQEKLGEVMGVTRSAVCYLEKGVTKSIGGDKLLLACIRFDVDPVWLLFGKGNKVRRETANLNYNLPPLP